MSSFDIVSSVVTPFVKVSRRTIDKIKPLNTHNHEGVMDSGKRRGGLFEECRSEMLLRGYSRKTVKSYLSWLRSLVNYFSPRHPRELDEKDIRNYLLHLIDEKRHAYATVNQAFNAIRFLYVEMYKREFVIEQIPRPKKGKSYPNVITLDEFKRMVDCTRNIKHRALLMVTYSGGLRLDEVVTLTIPDIDGERKLIFVKGGKFRKDRYTIISERALEVLREYYKLYRPEKWLFEGKKHGKHLHARSAQRVVERACKRAGLRKRVSMHTLRHSFATHIHEQGGDIRTIKELLGHEHLKTTEIYTHISKRSLSAIKNPLDTLDFE